MGKWIRQDFISACARQEAGETLCCSKGTEYLKPHRSEGTLSTAPPPLPAPGQLGQLAELEVEPPRGHWEAHQFPLGENRSPQHSCFLQVSNLGEVVPWATVGLRELSVDLDMDVWSP